MRECLARHDEILRDAIDRARRRDREDHRRRRARRLHHRRRRRRRRDRRAAARSPARGGTPSAVSGCASGVHTGEAELRDGDYYGSALNRAARLMSVAHGDQIVISHVTEDLARDALRGGHRAGRSRRAPPARPGVTRSTCSRSCIRTCRASSRACGRCRRRTPATCRRSSRRSSGARTRSSRSSTALDERAARHAHRHRRCGQDASRDAGRRRGRCRDSPTAPGSASLPPPTTSVLMAQVIANALGCQQRPGLSLADSIVEYLKVRSLLLVLDNCEHLLDDAGDARRRGAADACPGVKVLATSREALEVDGERRPVVRGSNRSATARKGAPRCGMFDDRARDAGATAPWTDEQWRTIAEICRRVDGIPLAIELAAARVACDVTGRDRRPSRRAVPHPHREAPRSPRAPADPARDGRLVVPAARRPTNGRCSTGWGSSPARSTPMPPVAVVSDDDTRRVAGARRDRRVWWRSRCSCAEDGPAATTRYSMLETLRVFARDQLDQTDDADRWRRRHAEYFAELRRVVRGGGMQGADDQSWTGSYLRRPRQPPGDVSWGLDRDDRDDCRRSRCGRSSRWRSSARETRPSSISRPMAVRALALVDGRPAGVAGRRLRAGLLPRDEPGHPERGPRTRPEAIRDGIVIGSHSIRSSRTRTSSSSS